MEPYFLRKSIKRSVYLYQCILCALQKYYSSILNHAFCCNLDDLKFLRRICLQKQFPRICSVEKVFSCELWEISKNIFSYRTTPVAASVFNSLILGKCRQSCSFSNIFSKYFFLIKPPSHLLNFYFLLVLQVTTQRYDDEVALDTIKHMNEAGN